jgi:dienelactone hydrolase
MEEVEAIKEAYANHSNAEIVVYPEAAHNFAMPYKAGYQEAAAKASRAAVLRCFQRM